MGFPQVVGRETRNLFPDFGFGTTSGWCSGSGELLKPWGRPHPEGAERLLGQRWGLGDELERDSLHFDLHLLNAVKGVQHLGEAGLHASFLEESALQSGSDQEGEEANDDVASDLRLRPVAHRPEL